MAEARRLFAANGFKATTVAHIQVACGLTPGSGALYKHFPSKYALLGAVAESFAAQPNDSEPDADPHWVGTPSGYAALTPAASLRATGESVFEGLLAQQALLRLLLRDLDEAPDLLEPLWQRCEAGATEPLQAWIERRRPDGTVYCADPQASATILAAALLHAAALIALTGRGPGGADPQTFLTAWVGHAAGALGLDPVGTSRTGAVPAAQLSLLDL